MGLVDVRCLERGTRYAAADRIRVMRDFDLPSLDWFNSDPCPAHSTLAEGAALIPPCRRCGIRFRKHQRVGIAWLWMRGKGLVADVMGSGKTGQAAGLIACMKQIGELEHNHRVVVVCRSAATGQWIEELKRFLPRLDIGHAVGIRSKRIEMYLGRWDVLVIGAEMFGRDHELLHHFRLAALIVDDVDPLRNPSTRTAYSIKRLAQSAARVAVLTGTPLQKKLTELHSIAEPIGGHEIFGSATKFRRDFVREELVRVYSPNAGRRITKKETTGYKNLDVFIQRFAPLTLRRTPEQIDDVDLPAITPNNIWLDLYPAQRLKYDELRRGVLTIIKESGTRVRRDVASAQFVYGAQICSGLVTLGEQDLPGTSVKLDWVEQTIVDGALSDEKVVVYCHFTAAVEALMHRFTRAGVGHVVIWGRENSRAARQDAKDRFWDDPTCRVLIGTDAIEQSLNLQVSRHLINVDQLMNPARMQQLAGRIRRDGSAYRTVYVHNLLTAGTQEAGYLDVLQREQALADHVWGETNQLYEALNPLAMLQLIGRSR